MPKFGIHAFTLNGEWNNRIAPAVIEQAGELGFDFIEIPLLRPDEFDSSIVKKTLENAGIEGVPSLCLPKDAHLPFNPSGALEFLKKAVDRVAEFGGKQLLGCIYCNLGTLTKAAPTAEEHQKIVDVLRELRAYAGGKGVTLGIEPVNRYETYLVNTGDKAADLIKRIGGDDMVIHFEFI
jgi:D-psicose/D-tagatose/L-ribulose 3-epimerase